MSTVFLLSIKGYACVPIMKCIVYDVESLHNKSKLKRLKHNGYFSDMHCYGRKQYAQ